MALDRDDILTDNPEDAQVPAGETVMPPALPPLTISALMVTKADLITALQVYLPHLSDIEMIDADRFLLTMGAEHPSANGSR